MRDYEELVKALRHCAGYEYVGKCADCPMDDCDLCQDTLFQNAADAIEELLKENGELENSGRVLMAAFDRLKEKVQKYRHASFAISETCVDESKSHISSEDAIKKIREHIYYDNTASCSEPPEEVE